MAKRLTTAQRIKNLRQAADKTRDKLASSVFSNMVATTDRTVASARTKMEAYNIGYSRGFDDARKAHETTEATARVEREANVIERTKAQTALMSVVGQGFQAFTDLVRSLNGHL